MKEEEEQRRRGGTRAKGAEGERERAAKGGTETGHGRQAAQLLRGKGIFSLSLFLFSQWEDEGAGNKSKGPDSTVIGFLGLKRRKGRDF